MNPKAILSCQGEGKAGLPIYAWAVSLTAIYCCGQALGVYIHSREAGFKVFLDMNTIKVYLQ